MKKILKNKVEIPQLIIVLYLIFLLIMVSFTDISYKNLFNDSINKFLMNSCLVLSLIPMINVGAGRNFGLPIGICAGLLGMCFAIEYKVQGIKGFFLAIIFSIPISIVFGYLYAKILNKVKGDEEIIGTFAGFSFIPLMSIFWTIAPFKNRQMLYPVGGEGLRPKINLENYFGNSLDNLLKVNIKGFSLPIGSILFFLSLCLIVKFVSKSRLGQITSSVEENHIFSKISGININKYRTLNIIFSTILASIGIIVYSQSYGFIHLYNGPLMMAFPAISAILIGGATKGKASILNVIIGTYLYQTTFLLSVPISNTFLIPEMSEIIRMIVTNGIILYAFIYEEGSNNEK